VLVLALVQPLPLPPRAVLAPAVSSALPIQVRESCLAPPSPTQPLAQALLAWGAAALRLAWRIRLRGALLRKLCLMTHAHCCSGRWRKMPARPPHFLQALELCRAR
jgi:hypothetical protein